MPWYRDLELERHGAQYIEPELNVVLIQRDGRRSSGGPTSSRRAASFAAVQRAGRARRCARWRDDFVPVAARRSSRPEAARRRCRRRAPRAAGADAARGGCCWRSSELSPLEFVQREFEHPAIQAGLLFFNGLREVDLRVRGLRPSHPGAAGRRRQGADVRRRLGRARARAGAGGAARPAARSGCVTAPRRILVEDGTRGRRGDDGRRAASARGTSSPPA